MNIRLIAPAENGSMAAILRKSLEEFGLNIPGTAYFNKSTDQLFEFLRWKKESIQIIQQAW